MRTGEGFCDRINKDKMFDEKREETVKSPQEAKGIPVEITMETVLKQQGSTERHLFEEMGKLIYMNDSHYIRYEETYDQQTVPVTVKLAADGVVSLIRRGDTTTRLRFDADEWTQTNYHLPQGILPVRVSTTQLEVSYYDQPFSGKVAVNYSLYVGEEKLGDYQLRLNFTT